MARISELSLERSLPRDAYLSADFYAAEQRSIFGEQWVYVGRAEQVAAPGDFRVVDLGGESIILLRDDDAQLRAFINMCRHRGSQLLCGDGHLRGTIRCPYHSWTYSTSGALIAAPHLAMSAVPEPARRLHSIGVRDWGGFLFVHLAPAKADAPGDGLEQQLGGAPRHLQNYPLSDLRIGRTIEYDVAANWKVILENYNECYHCAGVHPELCRIVPAFKQRGGADLDWESGIPHREGAFTFTFTGTTNREPFEGLDEEERARHKGELIYPNFMLSVSSEHVAAFSLWPQNPDRTRIVCDFLFHPAEIGRPDFDPSDAVEFWDLVNRQDWAICESVQRGMHSRWFRHGYYAKMEDSSLDIRRYIASRMGKRAIAIDDANPQ